MSLIYKTEKEQKGTAFETKVNQIKNCEKTCERETRRPWSFWVWMHFRQQERKRWQHCFPGVSVLATVPTSMWIYAYSGHLKVSWEHESDPVNPIKCIYTVRWKDARLAILRYPFSSPYLSFLPLFYLLLSHFLHQPTLFIEQHILYCSVLLIVFQKNPTEKPIKVESYCSSPPYEGYTKGVQCKTKEI